MEFVFEILGTVLPALSMMFVVYLLFKSIIGSDAQERKARAKIETEERAKFAAKQKENSADKGETNGTKQG